MGFRVLYEYNGSKVEISGEHEVSIEEAKLLLGELSNQVISFLDGNRDCITLPISYSVKISEEE